MHSDQMLGHLPVHASDSSGQLVGGQILAHTMLNHSTFFAKHRDRCRVCTTEIFSVAHRTSISMLLSQLAITGGMIPSRIQT